MTLLASPDSEVPTTTARRQI